MRSTGLQSHTGSKQGIGLQVLERAHCTGDGKARGIRSGDGLDRRLWENFTFNSQVANEIFP